MDRNRRSKSAECAIFSEITTSPSPGARALARRAALKILGPDECIARIREELKREDLAEDIRQGLLRIDSAVRERERRLKEAREEKAE